VACFPGVRVDDFAKLVGERKIRRDEEKKYFWNSLIPQTTARFIVMKWLLLLNMGRMIHIRAII